jgi:hypothetical protein
MTCLGNSEISGTLRSTKVFLEPWQSQDRLAGRFANEQFAIHEE